MIAMNVFDAIRDRNADRASCVAIRAGHLAITYGELFGQATQVASALQQHGLKPGAGFGIVDRNSHEFIIAMLAGLKCGAVVMPIAGNLTQHEQQQAISEAQLHAVLRENDGPVHIGDRHFALELIPREQTRIAPHIPDAAFIRFTSGTTGTSKGVVIGHHSVMERIEAANKGLQLEPGDAVVWVLPMAYHFVVSVMLYLYFGATIVLSDDLTAGSIIEAAEVSGARMLYASPMHIRLLTSDVGTTSLGPLERIISTSAGLPIDLCRRFHQKFGKPVCQAFGIIEVGLPIINLRSAAEHPEAIGHALPDLRVGILDDGLKEVPDGALGQLAIAGPGLFDGYLQPPAVRAEVLRNGWFLTGDLATRSADGLITIAGRSKSVINVAGNKVFPEEVEAVLTTHAAVLACRVVGGKHPLLGEVVEADVVLVQGITGDVEELISHCRRSLSVHKLPQRIRFVDQLLVTPTGKLKR